VSRGEPAPETATLIEATGGRVIRRDTAAEFLADLERRLKLFADHPTGETPATVHDATLALLREGDHIGLEQELRRERHWFATELTRVVEKAHTVGVPDKTTIPPIHEVLRPVVERRLASLLPLCLYGPEQFAAELRDLGRMLASRPLRGGYVFWNELPEWSCAWIGYVCGALCMRLDRIEPLAALFATTWTDPNNVEEPLVWLPAGDVARALGQLMVDGNWLSPAWEFLVRALQPMVWLRDRYPELYEEGEPRRSFGEFDLAYSVYMGNAGNRVIPFFALAHVEGLARRIHRDAGLRARLAPVLRLPADDFGEAAARAIRDAPGWGGGTSTSPGAIANILQFGTVRPE
jgi:hypothetical protein